MADLEMEEKPLLLKVPETAINIDEPNDILPAADEVKSGKTEIESSPATGVKTSESSRVNSQLLGAIKRNDINLLKSYLDRPVNPNIQFGPNKTSALHYATQLQYEDAVDALISYKADVNITNSQNQTPLYVAVESANQSLVQKYINEGAKIDHQDANQNTVVHFAARKGNDSILGLLVGTEAGKKVRNKNKEGRTPLHLAAESGSVECIQILLGGPGENVNETKKRPHSPQINEQDSNLNTALHIAADKGNYNALVALLDAGADPCLGNTDRRTPLHLAALKGHIDCVDYFIYDLDGDLDLNAADSFQNTPLHLAAGCGHVNVVQSLIDYAEVDLQDIKGSTPLHMAAGAKKNNEEIVRLLIDAGASIEKTDSMGDTPLHKAAFAGNERAVKFLIQVSEKKISNEEKANEKEKVQTQPKPLQPENKDFNEKVQIILAENIIYLKNNSGKTPLHIAAANGKSKSVQHLAEAYQNDTQRIIRICMEKPPSSNSGSQEKGKSANEAKPDETNMQQTSAGEEMQKTLLQTLVNVRDNQDETALHKAAGIGSEESIRILLKLGADLGLKTTNKISAASLILKMPNGVRVLSEAFDDAITTSTHEKVKSGANQEEQELKFDYTVLLTEHNRRQQMSVIEDILDDKKAKIHELLEHPLVESFLYFKWRKTWFIFFINILFYLALVGGITTLVLNRITHTTGQPHNLTSAQLDNPNNLNFDMPKLELSLKVIILMILVQEVFQFSALPTQYFLAVETWIKFGALISSTAILFAEKQDPWVLHTSIFAVLLGWTEVTLLMGRFPSLGIYPLMFYSVSKHLVKFIAVFFFLLAGFAFSFHIIFPHREAFHDSLFLPMLLVRTTAMMIGDMAFDEFFKQGEYVALGTAQVVYLFFLLFVALVLMNLLIALAVDDIQGLQKLGHITKLKKQAQFIIFVEDIVYSPLFRALVCPPIWRKIETAINQVSTIVLDRDSTSNWTRKDPLKPAPQPAPSDQATAPQSDQQPQPTNPNTFLAKLNSLILTCPRHQKHSPPLPLVERAFNKSSYGQFRGSNISISEVLDSIDNNGSELMEIKQRIAKLSHIICGSESLSDDNSQVDSEDVDGNGEDDFAVKNKLGLIQSDINDLKYMFQQWMEAKEDKGWNPIKKAVKSTLSSVLNKEQ